MSDVLTSKQKLIDMLAERSRKHDAFRLAEGRGNGYSEEMNAFDIAHGEVLDWLNDTDHLDELLGFLRAGETPAEPYASAIRGLDTLLRVAVSHIDMPALEISHHTHWALLVQFAGPAPKTGDVG